MCSKYLDKQYGSIQGCGAVTFLVDSGSGSGTEEVFRLRLRLRVKHFGGSGSGSEEVFRLRLRVKHFGSSGSGSGYDAQVLIWASSSNTIFKNVKYQNIPTSDLEFECYFEWVPLQFVTHCHPSVADTGDWRGHKLLGVTLSLFGAGATLFLTLRLRLRAADYFYVCLNQSCGTANVGVIESHIFWLIFQYFNHLSSWSLS